MRWSNTRIVWIFPVLMAVALPANPAFALLHHSRPPMIPAAPVGVQLSGTARGNGSSWQFEIDMNSSGGYYRKEWNGSPRDRMGFYRLVLIMDSFKGEYRRIWAPIDVITGTGYGHSHGKNDHEVGRRLFSGPQAVGTAGASEVVTFPGGKITEEYEGLQRRGSILIPSVIIWVDHSQPYYRKTVTYTVQHSELLYASRPTFFRSVLKQYFPKAAK